MPYKDPARQRAFTREEHSKLIRTNPGYRDRQSLGKKNWRKAHRPEERARMKKYSAEKHRRYEANLRRRFLDMYGHKCACCPETDERFLTLDHVRNDGAIERYPGGRSAPHRTRAQYLNAIHHYDPTRYRTLCYNCNLGRARNGGVCPHEDPRPQILGVVRSLRSECSTSNGTGRSAELRGGRA